MDAEEPSLARSRSMTLSTRRGSPSKSMPLSRVRRPSFEKTSFGCLANSRSVKTSRSVRRTAPLGEKMAKMRFDGFAPVLDGKDRMSGTNKDIRHHRKKMSVVIGNQNSGGRIHC